MENNIGNRRDFIKKTSATIGGSLFLSSLPWINTLNLSAQNKAEKDLRLGIIGPGSRGQYLMLNLKKVSDAPIVAVCDIYEPNLKKGLELAGKGATAYKDYRTMLEKEKLDGVIIATPLYLHAQMTIDALEAGVHVFCEKSMAKTMDDCLLMMDAWRKSGKILQIGHQRMFNLKYLTAIEHIYKGDIGKVTQIRSFWNRNSDWRRSVPSPNLERFINWRLYKEYSCGLYTELASHQIQVANWIFGELPQQVLSSKSLSYWHDGREVADNVAIIIDYPEGKKALWSSVISSSHYGLEEQIQGNLATMELEKGKLFWEKPAPAPGILQMINDIEHSLFDKIPLGGASWVPETANKNEGEPIIDQKLDTDGSDMQLLAFVNHISDNKIVPEITVQGYYGTIVTLMAYEAAEKNIIVKFDEKYRVAEPLKAFFD